MEPNSSKIEPFSIKLIFDTLTNSRGLNESENHTLKISKILEELIWNLKREPLSKQKGSA